MVPFRMRAWMTAVALVGILLIVSAPGTALADSNRPQEYLALGDSVAFGYNPLVDPSNANNFIGYPTPVAAALKETLTNAACSGETSSHFISLSGSDNGCGLYRTYFPLHTAYNTSQLDFADTFLKSHPNTLVVSLSIGANDVFSLVNACGGSSTPGEIACIQSGLPGALSTLSANLDTIYSHIRNQDGYRHKIVALTYYSLDYSDPIATFLPAQVNQVVVARTQAWGGVVADGFGTFYAASAAYGGDTCAAGLRIVVSSSPLACDIHPSAAGRALLAQAVLNALRPD